MIIDRLNNNGVIKQDYKLKFKKSKNQMTNAQPVFLEPKAKYMVKSKNIYK
jgi:hypothetical protein